MSELERSISDVETDINDLQGRKHRVRPDQKKRTSWRLPLFVIAAVFLTVQIYSYSQWIFGVPEDTVQADIILLLKNADQKLQRSIGDTNIYPEQLPPDSPRWLIGYKKTLAGYKISTKIEGVEVVLTRSGERVEINRFE